MGLGLDQPTLSVTNRFRTHHCKNTNKYITMALTKNQAVDVDRTLV